MVEADILWNHLSLAARVGVCKRIKVKSIGCNSHISSLQSATAAHRQHGQAHGLVIIRLFLFFAFTFRPVPVRFNEHSVDIDRDGRSIVSLIEPIKFLNELKLKYKKQRQRRWRWRKRQSIIKKKRYVLKQSSCSLWCLVYFGHLPTGSSREKQSKLAKSGRNRQTDRWESWWSAKNKFVWFTKVDQTTSFACWRKIQFKSHSKVKSRKRKINNESAVAVVGLNRGRPDDCVRLCVDEHICT